MWFAGAAARRLRCAPGRFVLIGLVVGRNGTLVVMAAVFALSFIWIQLIAQRHGLVVCLLGARTRPGQVAQRRLRVSVIVYLIATGCPMPIGETSTSYRKGVKWNPADHWCVAGELLPAETGRIKPGRSRESSSSSPADTADGSLAVTESSSLKWLGHGFGHGTRWNRCEQAGRGETAWTAERR